MATVLIVDDDPDEREFTSRALRRSGVDLECVEAVSGETALALLQSREELPALTLMDLKMPGMSGIDTLQRIRADARLHHLPVVIMTNSTLESDARAALAAGANDFLPKALDFGRFGRDIRAQVERWVGPTPAR